MRLNERQKKIVKLKDSGDLSLFKEIERVETKIQELDTYVSTISKEDGYTPIKDVDYFDGEDGLDGKDGVNGKDGKDGKDGIDGKDGLDGVSPETDVLVSETIKLLKEKKELDIDDINGLVEALKREPIDAKDIVGIQDLLPKLPPQYGGGSGATFLKSLRDVDLTNLVKNSKGKYILNKLNWNYYVMNWSVEPSLNTAITGGDVYDYTLNGVTRYRFVPTTYSPTTDAFYSSFDGTTLSDLIVTRG